VDGLLSEKEQIEVLRQWWRDNGLYIVAGVILGLALLGGWRWWHSQQRAEAGAASALYESLVAEVADLKVEAAEAKAAEMQSAYGDTVYARQTRLAMAKLYMDLGRDQDAARELAALVSDDGRDELQMIGRLRLARILLYQEKPEEAVDLLQGYGDTAFAARYAEAQGDAWTALGRYEEARQAYTLALAENPQARTVDATLVRMKINDLPPPTEDAAAAGGAAAPAPGPAAPQGAGADAQPGSPAEEGAPADSAQPAQEEDDPDESAAEPTPETHP
jgi:predicted negative regulator of RcsB-dependent stress response